MRDNKLNDCSKIASWSKFTIRKNYNTYYTINKETKQTAKREKELSKHIGINKTSLTAKKTDAT